MLVKQMWALGFGVLGVFLVLRFIAADASGDVEKGLEPLTNVGGLVLGIVFGVNGNRWRERNLASRGFDLKDTVTAANGEGAVALYLKDCLAKHPRGAINAEARLTREAMCGDLA